MTSELSKTDSLGGAGITVPSMSDQNPLPTHYIVSTQSADRGDAFSDEGLARKHFDRIAAQRQFVRLILVEDGKRTELERRNG